MGNQYLSALSPEFALLGLLAQQPAHGYDLHRRLIGALGQVWHVSLSQTYNILKRLEGRGYIAGGTHEQEKLPARRVFSLTEVGRQRFEEWLNTPSGCSVRAIRVEFVTRLYFASLASLAAAHRLIDLQKGTVISGLGQLEAALSDIPAGQTFNRLGQDLRIRQLHSILDWLDDCHRALSLLEGPP